MTGTEDTIQAYRTSASYAKFLATTCRNKSLAATGADTNATEGANLLSGVTSDATLALIPKITEATAELRTIAETLTTWARAADAYADEVGPLAQQADAHRMDIDRNQRSLVAAEDEIRTTAGDAIAYGYRRQALEREIEWDTVALGQILKKLPEAEGRLAQALKQGQDPVGLARPTDIRGFGAYTQELDPTGDAEFLWILLEMGGDNKHPASYGYPRKEMPLFNTDIYGNIIVSSTDVSQGAFGDCWFIATLMSVAAQKPEIIKKMITYDPETKIYTVMFYDKDLKPHPVEVDGKLLLASDGNTYGAGEPEDKVLWPAIAEKALAEYWGGYPNIESDLQSTAMRLITGSDDIHTDWIGLGPAEWFDDDTNATALSQTLTHGGIAVASTKNFGVLWGEENPHDLAGSHSYQVVGVYGDTVVVQNPWGTENHDPITLTWGEFHNYFQGIAWTD